MVRKKDRDKVLGRVYIEDFERYPIDTIQQNDTAK